MSSSIRLGERFGGRQAPRRESLLRIRYGRTELATTAVIAIYGAAAVYLVGMGGLTSAEGLARTVRAASIWSGFEPTFLAYGFERPPLLTLLTLPFAAFEGLRANGLAASLGAVVASGLTVPAAVIVARGAGLIRPARIMFTIAFALNPLLLYAGVFGLPEAVYAALVLMALAGYSAWLTNHNVAPVIASGVALGAAFLVRYNVLIIAAVMAFAYWYAARGQLSGSGRGSGENENATAHALAFLVPVVFTVGLWTLVAWFPRGETLGYLTSASQLTLLGNDDAVLLERMNAMAGSPFAVGAWVLGWSAVLAPASVIAIAAVVLSRSRQDGRGDVLLAVLCVTVLLPEAIALAAGRGQPQVSHLFVAIVPAFVVLAHVERRATGGIPPLPHERPRRRRQYGLTVGLLVASLASSAVLATIPSSALPAAGFEAISQRAPAPSADARAMAEYIMAHAAPGDVVADAQRHAEVILLTGDLGRFQTDGSAGEEAMLYEPYGVAQYVLARRALPGQGPGRIERGYPDLFGSGAPPFALEFESGDYRLYEVIGPALR